MSPRPFGIGVVHGVVAAARRPELPSIADAFDTDEVIEATAEPHALLISQIPPSLHAEVEAGTLFSDPVRISGLAMAHHRIMSAAAAATDVVPVRLGTLVSGPAGAEALLTREAQRFADGLAAIRNAVEFGIRMLPAPERISPIPAMHAAGSGRDYLRSRSHQRAPHRPASVVIALRELARRAKAMRARRLAARSLNHPPALADAAFLVDRGELAAFTECAGRIERRIADDGVALDLFGPLPAYSFVDSRAENDA